LDGEQSQGGAEGEQERSEPGYVEAGKLGAHNEMMLPGWGIVAH
jgi:hypothetical protein